MSSVCTHSPAHVKDADTDGFPSPVSQCLHCTQTPAQVLKSPDGSHWLPEFRTMRCFRESGTGESVGHGEKGFWAGLLL